MSRILDLLNQLQTEKSEAVAVHNAGSPPPGATTFPGAQTISFTARYGLRENPFSDSLKPEYYFRNSSHERIGACLLDTVREGISLGLVTGPAGSGKTMISQLLLQELGTESAHPLLVLVTPRMGKAALLREILRESGHEGLPVRARDLLDLLHRTVLDLHGQGKRMVILIDEAHFLSSDALHTLRTVSNLETPRHKLCTTILFAEDTFLRRLKHPSYRSLVTRMYHRLSLEPMSEAETSQYITFRLLTAGGEEGLLSPEARRIIHARSGGICREVNRLCHLALLGGARADVDHVGAELLESL